MTAPLGVARAHALPARNDILQAQPRAVAQLMRALEDEDPQAQALLAALGPHTGGAFVLGITGAPGAGKSTLVDALLTAFRQRGQKVGVVAVDPSSPLSGGALLGDRVRMQQHATDPGVFIRSLASRGNLGGLARSAEDVVDVLDVAGFSVVLLETVGVGQDEMEVTKVADATLVVMVPGLGDGVQALKSGLLEIADVFVVNKADREGADRTHQDLLTMLALRGTGRKDVPIVRTQAHTGVGVAELLACLDGVRSTLDPPGRRVRRQQRALSRLKQALATAVWSQIEAKLDDETWKQWASQISAGQHSFDDFLRRVFELCSSGTISK